MPFFGAFLAASPAPICKSWRHGCGIACRWTRYGRIVGQCSSSICRAGLLSARPVLIGSEKHFHTGHRRRGRAVPYLTLALSLFLSLSLSLSLVDKCPLDMVDICPHHALAGLFAVQALPCACAPPRWKIALSAVQYCSCRVRRFAAALQAPASRKSVKHALLCRLAAG